MKKAEIIKNGNVNLKTVKSGKKVKKQINWDELEDDFSLWEDCFMGEHGNYPSQSRIVDWFKKRLS